MRRAYLEVSLQFVIERSGIIEGGADRRLNAIQNLLARLTERWRGERRIEPRRDVRMSAATRDALVQWVMARSADLSSRERLAAYQSPAVIDEEVPAGLLRIFIPTPHA
jgi:hypothetical protein